MITLAPQTNFEPSALASPPTFEALIAPIQQCAIYAFRPLPRAHRQELVAEVIVNAYIAFARGSSIGACSKRN